MQYACGKSRIQSAGRNIVFRKSSDQFNGRRRHGIGTGYCKSRTDAGYGASKKGSKAAENTKNGSSAAGSSFGDEELLKDRETPVLKKRLLSSLVFFNCPDVFFHGAYDVGLAASGGACR